MLKEPKKAAGYVRVSTDAQIQGESLATQKNQIKRMRHSHQRHLIP